MLGPHDGGGRRCVVRAFVPGARDASRPSRATAGAIALARRARRTASSKARSPARSAAAYRLRARQRRRRVGRSTTPTPSAPCSARSTTTCSVEGTHRRLYERLGAHVDRRTKASPACTSRSGRRNARRVSVVGDFNAWDGRRHPMRKRVDTGVWEIFVPGVGEGALYKYEIIGADGALLPLKADPFGFGAELRPVDRLASSRDTDALRLDRRRLDGARARGATPRRAPMSIYEVHLGSWRRGDGQPLARPTTSWPTR